MKNTPSTISILRLAFTPGGEIVSPLPGGVTSLASGNGWPGLCEIVYLRASQLPRIHVGAFRETPFAFTPGDCNVLGFQ
jgi:hypothetical protein